MTQTLYLDLTFMSRRDAYYLFYKNYQGQCGCFHGLISNGALFRAAPATPGLIITYGSVSTDPLDPHSTPRHEHAHRLNDFLGTSPKILSHINCHVLKQFSIHLCTPPSLPRQ